MNFDPFFRTIYEAEAAKCHNPKLGKSDINQRYFKGGMLKWAPYKHSNQPRAYLIHKSRYSYPMDVTAAAAAAKSLQLYPTLCNPIDSSPPGSLVPGILQARTLKWVAISFSNA